jgi:hypothetical protein
MNTFFLKKRHPPPPCRFAWKLEGRFANLTILGSRAHPLGEIFVSFWKFRPLLCKSTKFVFRILWTCPDRQTCLGWNCNPQLLQPRFFCERLMEPLALFLQWWYLKKFSTICTEWEYTGKPLDIRFLEIIMRTFWWKSLRGWDFSRPQLVVVSGLFGGNATMDGIFLGHNLLLSRAFSVEIPRWMGFF